MKGVIWQTMVTFGRDAGRYYESTIFGFIDRSAHLRCLHMQKDDSKMLWLLEEKSQQKVTTSKGGSMS